MAKRVARISRESVIDQVHPLPAVTESMVPSLRFGRPESSRRWRYLRSRQLVNGRVVWSVKFRVGGLAEGRQRLLSEQGGRESNGGGVGGEG